MNESQGSLLYCLQVTASHGLIVRGIRHLNEIAFETQMSSKSRRKDTWREMFEILADSAAHIV